MIKPNHSLITASSLRHMLVSHYYALLDAKNPDHVFAVFPTHAFMKTTADVSALKKISHLLEPEAYTDLIFTF
jgi:hypothetical protein